MDAYRSFRNHTLLTVLRESFGSQPLRILEVGCGTGPSLDFLAKSSPTYSLFGMDASDTMLRQAQAKGAALQNPLKLTLGDATRLPFGAGFFDVVFATRFIHQFSHASKRQLWQEFQKVTRPGGLLIVEFYARPYHWLRYHLGARKGRSAAAYFDHYPSHDEMREIAGSEAVVHPLRLPGARLMENLVGESTARRLTVAAGRLGGGVFLDEYFVVARRP